jgi:poly-gamma-glutamate synthase PgsB/CapB
VNGTRGKTAVTQLTAEIFRQSGLRTLAKTTGDEPVLHWPDGRETPLARRGPAGIREQMRVIRMAARARVDAVVLECMALEPHLQEISEAEMVRAGIGAITNVRPDHCEVMGPSLADAAAALGRTIPSDGVLVCGADEGAARIADDAARKGVPCLTVEPLRSVPDPVLAENLALAAEIGRQARLPEDDITAALQRILSRGPGARARRLPGPGGAIVLVDLFSANDPVSTARLMDRAMGSPGGALPRPWVALLNARSDRPLRTLAFVVALAGDRRYDALAVAGSGRGLALRRLKKAAPRVRVINLAPGEPHRLLAEVGASVSAGSFTLFGVGNHRGPGADLRRHFAGGPPCC